MTENPSTVGSSRTSLLVAGSACTAGMVGLGVAVAGGVPAVDSWVLDTFYADPAVGVGRFFTVLSGLLVLVAVAVLITTSVVAWRSRRLDPATAARLLVVVLVCCTAALLQDVFQRTGPPAQPDWTYPSGHATVVTAVALTAVLAATGLPARWRNAVVATEAAAVVLTCVARVLAGEHYLTDVIGGAVGTVGIGLLTAAVLGWRPVSSTRA